MSKPAPDVRDAGKNDNRDDHEYPSSVPGDRGPDVRQGRKDKKTREVQPGTAEPGKSWHSRSPALDNDDDKLNQALKDSFPASDPSQSAQPGATGWDLNAEEEKEQAKRSAA